MSLTPMMIQYLDIKEKCKDCILFFRLGDFYEMFFEDAETASKELELVLTGRDCGLENRAPMCGIPYHAAQSYISKLISKGFKVAICEQIEDPALAKGIVKRDIIKVITPGTYTDSTFLEDEKNNFIMCLYEEEGVCGLSFADISTGEFYCTEGKVSIEEVLDEISKFSPSELIYNSEMQKEYIASIKERFNISFTPFNNEYFLKSLNENLLENLKGIDNSFSREIKISISGMLMYFLDTQKVPLSHINSVEYYNIVDYLVIDNNSRRNLELTETLRDKSKKGSLLWILDKTNTVMGARRLRKWLEQPLVRKKAIEERLDAIELLIEDSNLHEELKDALKDIYDIERLVGKISSKSVNAKELLSLKHSISKIPTIKSVLFNYKSSLLSYMYKNLDTLDDIYDILNQSISENPSIILKEGNLIKDGYNDEVDTLRESKTHGKEWIANLERTERENTGIKSLKVGYNKVFGYYIEVTKSNLDSVPQQRYIRKQTLSNGERYITPELKEMEEKILGAEEKLIRIEYELFAQIRDTIEKQIHRMKSSAKIISEIDCLSALSTIAIENNYCKPKILAAGIMSISEGRHPVVEKVIEKNSFVENDTYIDNKDSQLLLITGPNMAGKSTYMRQVALITIMAQIGSYVPAKDASISICDKIFTRIGASDDLASGKSTFMVEMSEVSNILNNATDKSLVLLDEVGRGTSTYDGLSIAWAVIEYICNSENLRCKTLFATHYHELIKLEKKLKGVKNYSVAVKEINNEIVFLRKIVEGGTDESYGIEVARLAGIPLVVIDRAKEILRDLEKDKCKEDCKDKTHDNKYTDHELNNKSAYNAENKPEYANEHMEINNIVELSQEQYKQEIVQSKQIDFMDLAKENLIDEIKSIDILSMNPMEGFNKLYDIINKVKNLN